MWGVKHYASAPNICVYDQVHSICEKKIYIYREKEEDAEENE